MSIGAIDMHLKKCMLFRFSETPMVLHPEAKALIKKALFWHNLFVLGAYKFIKPY